MNELGDLLIYCGLIKSTSTQTEVELYLIECIMNKRPDFMFTPTYYLNALQYRDLLVLTGYDKEKANKITLDKAKETFNQEQLDKLKETLND